MASDKEKYKRCLQKWDLLHEEGLFSVPESIGKVAIFCSYAIIDQIGERTYKRGHKDVTNFRKEAFAIADRFQKLGKQSEIILNANDIDFDTVLRDEHFSDIITIGHGNLSTIIIGDDYGADLALDWYDLSIFTDHLKTGDFIQRQCGTFGRDLSVPLGMFCVSRHCDVIASAGSAFEPKGLDHPANNLLDYVTTEARLDYKSAKATFSY